MNWLEDKKASNFEIQNHSTISSEQVKATKITTANWIKLLFSFVQTTASQLEACLINVGPIRPCVL